MDFGPNVCVLFGVQRWWWRWRRRQQREMHIVFCGNEKVYDAVISSSQLIVSSSSFFVVITMFMLNMQQCSTTAPTIVEHEKKVTKKQQREKKKKQKNEKKKLEKRMQWKKETVKMVASAHATKLNKYQLIFFSLFSCSPPLATHRYTRWSATSAQSAIVIVTKWIKIDSKFECVSGAILDSALVGHRMHKLHSLVVALGPSSSTLSKYSVFFFSSSSSFCIPLNVSILFYCLSLSPTTTSPQYLQCLDAFHRLERSVGQWLNIIVVQR